MTRTGNVENTLAGEITQETEIMALRWAVKMMGFDPEKIVDAAINPEDTNLCYEAILLSHVSLDEVSLKREVGQNTQPGTTIIGDTIYPPMLPARQA